VTLQISVVGGGSCSPEVEAVAEAVGRLVAERGWTLVCGGLGGVMEAAARGARVAGGTTIGILPGESHADANPWIEHAIVTGIGHARNLAVAASGHALIAVGGEWGTASEIAFARRLGRPAIIVGLGPPIEGKGVMRVATPAEAVELALRLAGGEEPA
jgi:uncharacterized protein (TIGR00725 family)